MIFWTKTLFPNIIGAYEYSITRMLHYFGRKSKQRLSPRTDTNQFVQFRPLKTQKTANDFIDPIGLCIPKAYSFE